MQSLVNVVTPPSNSTTAELNSYQVQFLGPDVSFGSELFVTRPISGTLERICNADGTWVEKISFTTTPSVSVTVIPAPAEELVLTGDVVGSGDI